MNDGIKQEQEQQDNQGLLGRIGQLTRQLRDGLRELGLDRQVAVAAQAVPDARDRLKYIAAMTEQAAERALNAIDVAQPLQESLAADARALQERWAQWSASAGPLNADDALAAQTRAFLEGVPARAAAINAQLIEIMMAQDFQDLTGQVIKKMMEVINEVESELLQVLIDHAPRGALPELGGGLQNGPQVRPGQATGVSSQQEADDLLASLGF